MNFPFGQYTNLEDNKPNEDIDILNKINELEGSQVIIDRIGIQAHPGMTFFLNGEEMHIGRTGLFEIETDIQKFTINGQNPFIVDYHIKQI